MGREAWISGPSKLGLSQRHAQTDKSLAETLYFPEYLLTSFWTNVLSMEHSLGQSRRIIVRVKHSFSKKSYTGKSRLGVGKTKGKIRRKRMKACIQLKGSNCFELLLQVYLLQV